MSTFSLSRILQPKTYPTLIIGVSIILLAAWLRIFDIGASPFMADHERISILASTLAKEGDWDVLGPRMSVGSLKHSPLTIYLYALPYRLDNDPRVARLFTALLNLIAIAIVHAIGKRYFGPLSGLLAAFFLAINPIAVHHSRFIWNPNLAPPFVMLFVMTTLFGYYGKKPIARLAHLPALSLAGQFHPTIFLLTPIAILSWLYGWRHHKSERRRIYMHTVFSGLIALLLMVPWAIGLYKHIGRLEYLRPIPHRIAPDWHDVTNMIFASLSGSFDTFGQDIPSLPALGFLTLVGALWLLIRGLSHKEDFPGLIIVAAFFTVPIVVILLSAPLIKTITEALFFTKGVELNWCIWMTMGNAALIQGAIMGGVVTPRLDRRHLSWFWQWRGLLLTKHLIAPTMLALFVGATILLRAHLHYDYRQDTGSLSLYEGKNTLSDSAAALKYSRQIATSKDQEVIILASDPPLQTMKCVGCRNWEALMLTKETDIRVIWDQHGVPVPDNGAVLLTPFNYSERSLIFSERKNIFTWFSIASLPPPDYFKPDLPLAQPVQLANGATVLGFLLNTPHSMPLPDKTWTIYMLWRLDTEHPQPHKLSVQLVDANGTKYSQVDPPGILESQQYPGEHILSKLDLHIHKDLPRSGPLFLRFGMYNSDGHTDVVGTELNNPDLIQFRGNDTPLARLENGLQIDSFSSQDTLSQGPPLTATITWKTPAQGTNLKPLSLNWQLHTEDHAISFNHSTNLTPDSLITQLPGNIFLKETYLLRLPTTQAPGKYRLILIANDSTGDSPIPIFTHHLQITPRKRNFDIPPMQNTVNKTFADQIALLGYDIEHGDNEMTLVLHWNALSQIPIDYKYFVHLWRKDYMVAQLDAMPNAYGYPTSWWAPDEIFSDHVVIDLADIDPGELKITTGLYDPLTEDRLPVTNSGNESETFTITLGTTIMP